MNAEEPAREPDSAMRSASKKKDRGKIENRDRLLDLLGSMGAPLPSSTALSEEILENKLTSAINYAQNYAAHSDKVPFDPSELQVWKVCLLSRVCHVQLATYSRCRTHIFNPFMKPSNVGASQNFGKFLRLMRKDHRKYRRQPRIHS